MEILLLLFTAGFEILPGFRSVLADLIGKVSWSALVCAELALGTTASKVRAPFMGLLGLLAAPSPSTFLAPSSRGWPRPSKWLPRAPP
jgi:hypothetical protein